MWHSQKLIKSIEQEEDEFIGIVKVQKIKY